LRKFLDHVSASKSGIYWLACGHVSYSTSFLYFRLETNVAICYFWDSTSHTKGTFWDFANIFTAMTLQTTHREGLLDMNNCAMLDLFWMLCLKHVWIILFLSFAFFLHSFSIPTISAKAIDNFFCKLFK
jgi:hypothetical protein